MSIRDYISADVITGIGGVIWFVSMTVVSIYMWSIVTTCIFAFVAFVTGTLTFCAIKKNRDRVLWVAAVALKEMSDG